MDRSTNLVRGKILGLLYKTNKWTEFSLDVRRVARNFNKDDYLNQWCVLLSFYFHKGAKVVMHSIVDDLINATGRTIARKADDLLNLTKGIP